MLISFMDGSLAWSNHTTSLAHQCRRGPSTPSFRGDAKASSPESRDSGSGPSDHPGMTVSNSGRAAHIGFAPADHALGRGLGVRLGRGGAGPVFEIGRSSRIAAAEPRFRAG